MRRNLLIILAVVMLIAGGITVTLRSKENKPEEDPKIRIIQYEIGTFNQIKKVNLNSSDDIEKMETFVQELKLLSGEDANITLSNEIAVAYGDDIHIVLSSKNKDYCYYENTEENIDSVARTPDGLFEWVIEK